MSQLPSSEGARGALRISVVIPTYQRSDRVARLVEELAAQTLSPDAFEVVVVDDGSTEDPRPRLSALSLPFRLTVERQENQGPPAARHRGVELASAPIVLFLDDDMIPAEGLLEAHLAVHDAAPRAAVIGCIRASKQLSHLSIFERFHAKKLDDFYAALHATGRAPRGMELCTGNLSVRRDDYFAVGGFDKSLRRSEDAELGLKLERSGVALRLSDAGYSIHDSDHAKLEGWLGNAYNYGVSEQRIARKHADVLAADPWHWLDVVSLLPRPAYAVAVAAPDAARPLVRAVMRVAERLDAAGLERPALTATMLAYGMEYFRGVRAEAGSALACARDLARYRVETRASGAKATPLSRFMRSVRADHEMLLRYDGKYDTRGRAPASLPHDLVERIGFQIMTAYRLMQLVKESGSPLGAKVIARLIRFGYGADIHWDAHFADGVTINHGMGLAVGHDARIGRGVILSHNVGIGDGIDPKTRAVGTPTIEDEVHIGPGVLVLGPITVGARTKIMPNAVVLQSVPADSLVETPLPRIAQRAARRGNGDASRPTADAAPPLSSPPAGSRASMS